jgi:branched-chain amino acid transport system substrate-binding protein
LACAFSDHFLEKPMQLTTKLIPLAVALAFAGSAHAQEVVIKIGHVGPVSGPSSHLGKDNENGARLAIEELNAKGHTINGKKVKFELIAEDDAADPKQGTAVAQKLVDAKVHGVIGHLNSGTSVPASRIYHQAGIPQVSPASTIPIYTKQGYKTAFRVVANDAKLGSTLGTYAINKLKAAKIAVIDDRSAYGQGVADEFIKGANKAKAGVVIKQRQYTNQSATDFTAILTAVKAQKPDLVFFGGMDSVGGPMLKQMKALGLNAKFMGGDGICTESLAKLAGDGIGEEIVTCAEPGGVEAGKEKALDDFKARYQKRFNQGIQLYSPYVYDATMVMANAMLAAKSSEPAKYLPELKKTQHQGVTGAISFDNFGDLKDGAMTMYTYRGGKKTKLEVVR